MTDFRDLVVEDLALENAGLRERLTMLPAYKETAIVAIAQIAERDAEIERLRRRVETLIDELRCARGFESEAA